LQNTSLQTVLLCTVLIQYDMPAMEPQRKTTSNTGSLFNADIERKAMNSMEYSFFLFI